MASRRKRPWYRRRWLLWTLIAAAGSLGAIAIVLTIAARRFEPYLRARLVEGLEQRFHTKVELGYFHVAVHHGQQAEWGLWATGRDLRIWPPHLKGRRADVEQAVESQPLIELREFRFHVPLRWEQRQQLRIPQVRLHGLVIRIPPKSERDRQTGLESAVKTPPPPAPQPQPNEPGALANVVVREILCDDTELVLETDTPGRVPLTFDLQHLELDHVAAGQPMEFKAVLTNPEPAGVIYTSGKFGPLDTQDFGVSPVQGSYSFEDADLATITGIAGTLNSTGSYEGTLRMMRVLGQANVENFSLTSFNNPLPLHTRFNARVDGTNGDTWLEPVDATLGHSHFVTRGHVVRVYVNKEGRAAKAEEASTDVGHDIALQVNVDRGRAEDFLRLVAKTPTPLLTGDVTTHAKVRIPPGPEPVHERMVLDGAFRLDNARFTDAKLQAKVAELSERGQGHPHATADASALTSSMQGEFHLAHGVMALPQLQYSVPGAQIDLKGTYALDGALHFDGTARMQATVSKMVGGWKGFLLRPADRFFRKNGAGTVVPIRVRGTRKAPQFAVDLGKLGGTHPARPGGK